ncbi:MAG TPA: hypothetical protein VK915_13855 [Gaiellaceae bacterium]|nr:hypothetical protein [Gaiellaceae bacterium]
MAAGEGERVATTRSRRRPLVSFALALFAIALVAVLPLLPS